MAFLKIPTWTGTWNRKLHIYIGLYFLFFIWLFSLSGLLLNHPRWKVAQFWSQRKQTSSEQSIRPLMANGDLPRARELMAQLRISGEIERITTHPEEGRLDLQVVRPGRIVNIKADIEAGLGTVEEIETNWWGILHMLHKFNGVRMENPEQGRDWFVTKLWSFSMDAVCLGIIFLVLSGLYMGYQVKEKRRPGLGFLGAGMLCCGIFVFGLGWTG